MSNLAPIAGNLRTRCSECNHPFYIRPSLSMRCGLNSGHCNCPKCKTFLRVEILEGDEAWTEPYEAWTKRTEAAK